MVERPRNHAKTKERRKQEEMVKAEEVRVRHGEGEDEGGLMVHPGAGQGSPHSRGRPRCHTKAKER